jgi:PAS domain S-box-containing protein
MPATSPIRVLLVEDDEADAMLVQRALHAAGLPVAVTRADRIEDVHAALRDQSWDIVLCDYSLPGLDVTRVMDLVAELAPQAQVVVVSGTVGEEAVADLIRRGAADLVLKDRLSPRLGAVVLREAERARARRGLEERQRRTESVLAAFREAADWRDAVAASLTALCTSLGASAAVMWEVTGPAADLLPIGSWATPDFAELAAALRAVRLPAESSVVGRAVLRGEAVVLTEISPDARPSSASPMIVAACRHGMTGLICQPVEEGGRRFGLMMLFDDPAADLNAALGELAAVSAALQPALFRKLMEYERTVLHDALDAAHSGVIVTEAMPVDPPGPRIVYANRAISTMSGYPLRDLLGNTPRIFQGPDTSRETLREVRRALLAGESVSVELTNYRSDSTTYPVELDITPVRDQERITHFIAVQTDITKRRTAEAALRASEREFRTLAEAMPQIVWMNSPDGKNVYFNQQWMDYTGLTLEESLGDGWREPFHPDDRQAAWEGWLSATATKSNYSQECRLRRADGEYRWWLVRAVPLLDDGGNVIKWFGTCTDIHDLKTAEIDIMNLNRVLRASEARLDRAQAVAGIGSWEVDTSTGELTWSRELYRIRGLDPDKFRPTGTSVLNYISPDDWDTVRRFRKDIDAGISAGPIEFTAIRADGTTLLCMIEAKAIVEEDGTVKTIVGTCQDITQRRLIERQLAHAQRMEAIGSLTAGMSHDFNNMLAVVIVNLELAMRRLKDDALNAELCAEALDGAKRCAKLIQRLLAFARRQPLHPEQTDVNALVDDISHLLQRTLGETITLKFNLDPGLWPVLVDPAQLEAALVNFATNARDAMPNGGRVDIATKNAELDDGYLAAYPDVRPGEYVLISVTDTGSGIAPDVINRIFEPFFTTKSAGEGTGLGLSMAFGFAKQSGGHLSVYSEVGIGTTFRLYLPRSRANAEARTSQSRADEVTGGTETILIVEDNASLRRAATRQLQGLGYQVREAENADAALAILSGTDHVDLLFTDVVMPGAMDGVGLAQAATWLRPGLAVLLVSGFHAIRANADPPAPFPYRSLTKPYSLVELCRALREALGRA